MERRLTVVTQFKTPKQSPVPHALCCPFALLVPSSLKLQFVLPHIRPCQLSLTFSVLTDPAANSKPLVSGPLPAWVPMPGQMVSPQELRIRISVVSLEGALPVWREAREGLLEPGHTLYGDAAWVDEVRRSIGRKLDMARLVRERCIFDLAIMCSDGSVSCTRANGWRSRPSIGTEVLCCFLLLFVV